MVVKVKNMVSLSFLVHTKSVPDRVNLKDQGLHYVGEDKDSGSAGLITGVYGSHSKQMALVCAANWSRERSSATASSRILMLDANYRVDMYQKTRTQTRRETLAQTGWLHLDRVAASFREEIKESWLNDLESQVAPGVMTRIKDLSLTDLAQRFPKMVTDMLKADSSIRGIVHPVHPLIDESVSLWVATVRYEKDRFDGAVVRFLPQVEVVY